MNNIKIFIIEDDKAIGHLISATLETQGYAYSLAKDGRTGLSNILSYNPDIIILDLGLPDIDGVSIIKKIRTWSDIPIIVVSARSDDSDKILALDSGADDYLTKPFSTAELLVRIRVALRRFNILSEKNISPIYINGNLKIDFSLGLSYLDNKELHLTPIEYKLLVLLAKNTGKVLTHNFILKEIWGNYLINDTKSLRVFMATLRKKIEKDSNNPKFIQTHIGVGYRLLKIET